MGVQNLPHTVVQHRKAQGCKSTDLGGQPPTFVLNFSSEIQSKAELQDAVKNFETTGIVKFCLKHPSHSPEVNEGPGRSTNSTQRHCHCGAASKHDQARLKNSAKGTLQTAKLSSSSVTSTVSNSSPCDANQAPPVRLDKTQRLNRIQIT